MTQLLDRRQIIESNLDSIAYYKEYQDVIDAIVAAKFANYAYNLNFIEGGFVGESPESMFRHVVRSINESKEHASKRGIEYQDDQEPFCLSDSNIGNHEELLAQFKQSDKPFKYLFLNTLVVFEYNVLNSEGKRLRVWDMHSTPLGKTDPESFEKKLQELAEKRVPEIEAKKLSQLNFNPLEFINKFKILSEEEKLEESQGEIAVAKKLKDAKKSIRNELADQYDRDLLILKEIGMPDYILGSPNQKALNFMALQNHRHSNLMLLGKAKAPRTLPGVEPKDFLFIDSRLLFVNPYR